MGRQSATRSARGNREIISEGRKYDGLLELLTRLQVISLANEHSYQMPLTQALVGDALGLSVPHVSRTLRQLAEEDLVAIEGQKVLIKHVKALSRLAYFERTYLGRFQLNDLFGET